MPRPWLIGGAAGTVLVILLVVLWGVGGDEPVAEPGGSVASEEPATARPGVPATAEPHTSGKSEATPPSTVSRTREAPERDAAAAADPPARTADPAPSSLDRIAQTVPRTSSGTSRDLVGTSRQYDDLHCQRIQIAHGVRIPAAATVLEVDGVRLPIDSPGSLSSSPAPVLLLPRGDHCVRFRTTERPLGVTVSSHLLEEYRAMRRFFDVDGSVRGSELLRRGAWAMDVHNAPFLLNFTGARHAKEGRWAAAERYFRRALNVNPTFSPAHLNLVECLVRREAAEEALGELAAADVFNVGDVYGLADAVSRTRRKLGIPLDRRDRIDAATLTYVSTEDVTEEDRRLAALMEGISKYAVQREERGKILNNLAVHFADTGRPELALHHFRHALAVVKFSGTGRFAVARQVFSNMSRTCRSAGFDEADEYQQMQFLVTR